MNCRDFNDLCLVRRDVFMSKYVGREFKSRKTYPFTTKGRKSEEETSDINYGEKVRVESFDKETGLYKVLNLSIPPHWVMVSEQTLKTINGQWR
jgi:hypothetical protein